ncbi:Uncharacterized protein XB15_03091 [Leptospira santarosai]|nr:Uncharacterized protein XB15_03091 [Leptospira santarosai]
MVDLLLCSFCWLFLYRFLSKRVIAKGAKGSEEAIVRAREAIMSAVRKVNNCNGRYTHVQTSPWHSIKENHHHNNTQCDPGSQVLLKNGSLTPETSLYVWIVLN